jgi:hypothetical protein
MPEVTPIRLIRPVITCFLRARIEEFQHLLLIHFERRDPASPSPMHYQTVIHWKDWRKPYAVKIAG